MKASVKKADESNTRTWSTLSLRNFSTALDTWLTAAELSTACTGLTAVEPEQIAGAIGICPDDWGVDEPERIALAEYLHRRRAEIIAAYPH